MNIFDKLRCAGPKQAVVYHVGNDLKGAPKPVVAMVRNLYDRGSVDLVQRRCERGFEYVCQFRRVIAKIDRVNTFAAAGTVV